MKCIFIIVAAICLVIEGTPLPLSSIAISGGSHSSHHSTSLYHETTGPFTTTSVVNPSLVNLRSSGLISINGLDLPTIGSLPVLGSLTTTYTGGLPLLNQLTGIRHHVTGDSNIDNTVVQQDGVYRAVSGGAVHIASLPGRGSTTAIST